MADDKAQGPEDTSWWASDALPNAAPAATAFDEPLVWPESPGWEDVAAAGAPPLAPLDIATGEVAFSPLPDADPPTGIDPDPVSDAQWQPTGHPADSGAGSGVAAAPGPETGIPGDPDATEAHFESLAGLGGGAGGTPQPEAAPAAGALASGPRPQAAEPVTKSIWSNDVWPKPLDVEGLGSVPFPALYAEAEQKAGGPRWRRLDVRPGNAAVIALISVVSLVLVGMFLSVRARDDVPTDASQSRPAGDGIQVNGTLNTVPLTTTPAAATTTTPPTINLQELIPPAAAPDPGAATGVGPGPVSPATTAAPPRTPATTSGSGSGSGTTTPATRSTATTEAPTPTTEATSPATSPPATSPPATSPPNTEDTTATTRRPPPTFTLPTYTVPTAPPATLPFPGRVPSF